MCDELESRVLQRQPQPKILPRLAKTLQAEWATIPRRVVSIVSSMGRMPSCLYSNDDHTISSNHDLFILAFLELLIKCH